MPREGDIKAVVENGEICIYIPIGDFVTAVREGRIGSVFQEGGVGHVDNYTIPADNEDDFAQDVIDEIMLENEEGDTMLYQMLDTAVDNAFENGATSVDYGDI